MQIQGYGNKKNCNNYDKGVRKGDVRTIATNLKRCEKAGFESPLTPDDIKNALGCVIGMPGACGCTVAPRRASQMGPSISPLSPVGLARATIWLARPPDQGAV
jgi:hypothetical protein